MWRFCSARGHSSPPSFAWKYTIVALAKGILQSLIGFLMNFFSLSNLENVWSAVEASWKSCYRFGRMLLNSSRPSSWGAISAICPWVFWASPASTSISRLCQELIIKEFECCTQGSGWWRSVAASNVSSRCGSTWAFCIFLPDVKKSKELKRDNLRFCKELLQRRREEIQEIEATEGKEGKEGTERNGKRSQNHSGDLLLDCFFKTPYESEDHRAAVPSCWTWNSRLPALILHLYFDRLHPGLFPSTLEFAVLGKSPGWSRSRHGGGQNHPESPALLCSKTSVTPWPLS